MLRIIALLAHAARFPQSGLEFFLARYAHLVAPCVLSRVSR
jgi:hypothetical protein